MKLSRNLTLGGLKVLTSQIRTSSLFWFELTSYDLMTSPLSVAIKDDLIAGVSLRMVCARSLGGARGD